MLKAQGKKVWSNRLVKVEKSEEKDSLKLKAGLIQEEKKRSALQRP